LVRLRRRPGEKRHNWLLIKASDDAARTPDDPDILEEMPDSAISGRTIEEIAAGKGPQRVWHSSKSVSENVKAGATRRGSKSSKARTKKAVAGDPLPEFVSPSLAMARETIPNGRDWVHEIKFDGYRTQARLERGKVKLLTRKGLDWSARFPNVAADVARLAADAVLIDGEIVVENSRGVPDFSMLQDALGRSERDRFIYYVFDLLHLDGEDLSRRPLIERKDALKQLLDDTKHTGAIRYSEHFVDNGSDVWDQACRMNLEGIVSKHL
jgi:bifunctional non-homologous end joining protein LigD